MDDARLARAAAAGDQEAFAEIVERHAPAMLRYARRIVGSRADAEDVVQDALVSAWRGIDTYRGDAAVRTWLFTLTSRRAVDVIRRRRGRVVLPIGAGTVDAGLVPADSAQALASGSGTVDPSAAAEVDELVAALDRALHTLPWRQRAVWVLREVEGLSYGEIAAVLATRPSVVRGQLARARPALAKEMTQWR